MRSIFKVGLSFLTIGSILLLSGCIKSNSPSYKVDLEIWGAVDDSQAFGKIIDEYKKINPYVGNITYRKMVYDDYKKDVVDALASGQGPDIFLINNNWLPYFKNKIEPAPSYLLNEAGVQASFVDTVDQDFVSEGSVYALPLSVDSLALYCNKDLFNAVGLTSYPTTWEEVKGVVKKLTKIDEVGIIKQSGLAMGTTSRNINRATDVLSLLMLQSGAKMTNEEKNAATFNDPVFKAGNSERVGEEALKFYTQFADSNSPETYTWNPSLHYSVDAFGEDTVAMMVNYSWQTSAVKLKNSKLNFTVVPIPQMPDQKPLTFASYTGFAVTKNKMLPKSVNAQNQIPAGSDYNKLRIHEAWQFIKFLTMKNGGTVTLMNAVSGTSKAFPMAIDPASDYLKATERPAARKDLIETQKNIPILGTFALGNLTATSWYQTDPESISAILDESIDAINKGSISPYKALELAAQRVTQLMTGK